MTEVGIFILSVGSSGEPVNEYLCHYDPEYHSGLGFASFTLDPQEAMRFPTAMEALELYRTIPASRPTRKDGQPNRPLMTFTVEIKALPPLDTERCLARDAYGQRCKLQPHPEQIHHSLGINLHRHPHDLN